MKQTTLNVRMDEETRRRFDAFCSSIGLTASAAVNLFVKSVLREHRIPFEITDRPSWETLEVMEDTLNRRNLHGPFASVEALMADLDAPD